MDEMLDVQHEAASPGRTGVVGVRCALCLLAVVLLGGSLRWAFLVGPAASDDTRYMKAAQIIARGEPTDRLDHAYIRAAFVLWLAMWVKLGAGTMALAGSEVALSLATMLTIYWLATKWADRSTALLALVWLACLPLDLLTSGLLAPDRLALLLALLAAGCAYDALRADSGQGHTRLILAGIFTGLAVSAKEPSVILPIIFGVWALWRVRPLKTAIARAVLIGAVSVGVFGLEHVFFYFWTGDWAYRYHALSALYGNAAGNRVISLRNYLYYPAQILANPKVMGMYGWVMLIALLRTYGKLKEPHIILVWSLCYFLFMQYGSSSFEQYRPLPKQWRYMHPMVILLLIPLGRWTIELFRSNAMGKIGTVLLTVGILISGVLAANGRAAEGLYSESSLRCLAIAQKQIAGTAKKIVLPDWVARGTALELEARIENWPRVDLSDGLQVQEAKLLAQPNTALLVPEIMWHHKHDHEAYVRLKHQLSRHAEAEPIEDWRSPLDRLVSRFEPLRSLGRKTVIGHFYRIDTTRSEVWNQ